MCLIIENILLNIGLNSMEINFSISDLNPLKSCRLFKLISKFLK